MKKEFNDTLIFYINEKKASNDIKTWQEGASLYYEIEGKEINTTQLTGRIRILLVSADVNTVQLIEYHKMSETLFPKKELPISATEKESASKLPDELMKTCAISNEDLGPIFGVDVENDSESVIRKKIINKIADEKFILMYMGYNPGLFKIASLKPNSWTVYIKEEDERGVKKAVRKLNVKFEINIVKRKEKIIFYTHEECDQFLKNFLSENLITPYDLFEHTYRTDKRKVKTPVLDENLLMVCPGLEMHIGKLGSVVDFEDYSTKQALWRVKKVVEDICIYQQKMKASKLLLGVGNDYFNADTTDDRTTADTQQNNDTRYKEVYLWGKVGYIRLIETLKNSFDKTIIKGNPGNHDEKTSFSLFTYIYGLYNLIKDPKVEVPFTFADMRFTTGYEFGENLIIFSHGKSPDSKNIPDATLAEAAQYQFKEEFNRAKCVYIFAGHLHTDSEKKFGKITVIRTASLTGIEAWHAANAYIGQREGHSIYLIDKERGYMGKHNITLTEKERTYKLPSVDRSAKANIDDEFNKAFDTSPESIQKMILTKKLRVLNELLTKKNNEFNKTFSNVVKTLGSNVNDYSEAQKKQAIELMGYNEEVEQIVEEQQMVKKLLHPNEKRKVLKA